MGRIIGSVSELTHSSSVCPGWYLLTIATLSHDIITTISTSSNCKMVGGGGREGIALTLRFFCLHRVSQVDAVASSATLTRSNHRLSCFIPAPNNNNDNPKKLLPLCYFSLPLTVSVSVSLFLFISSFFFQVPIFHFFFLPFSISSSSFPESPPTVKSPLDLAGSHSLNLCLMTHSLFLFLVDASLTWHSRFPILEPTHWTISHQRRLISSKSTLIHDPRGPVAKSLSPAEHKSPRNFDKQNERLSRKQENIFDLFFFSFFLVLWNTSN